jgi:hypothetical protein
MLEIESAGMKNKAVHEKIEEWNLKVENLKVDKESLRSLKLPPETCQRLQANS